MDTILIITICGLILGWLFSKSSSPKSKTDSGLIKIDDKNWIANGKLVSFETNTPMLRYEQKREDDRHYFNYESMKLKVDSEKVYRDWITYPQVIHDHPHLKDSVTEEKLESITEEYDRYIHMCDKLNMSGNALNKEEFLIKKDNPLYFPLGMSWNQHIHSGIYQIYCEEASRYVNGNMSEIMEGEFKKKWYTK